jgi:3-oxoadipate enol-lactonase
MLHQTAPTTGAPSSALVRDGRLVPVRDTRLFVQQRGSGPVLLFVHGMCGDAEVWSGQVDRLAEHFTCVSYDRRGHSLSPAGEEDQSYATHADDAAALIAALGIEGCTLVGSSGGAYVGFELMRRHPGTVRAAVLSEPPIFLLCPTLGSTVSDEVAPVVRAAAESGGEPAAVDAFFELLCPGLWSQLDEPHRQRYRVNGPMLFPALTAPADPVSEADLGAVDVPVLLVKGSDSHPALRAVVEVLANGLPDATVLDVRDSGHVTYAEQPETFAAAVRDFADRVTRTAAPLR